MTGREVVAVVALVFVQLLTLWAVWSLVGGPS